MVSIFKQSVILLVCSIIIGFSFNHLRPNGIALLAKNIGLPESLSTEEFGIKTADIATAKTLFDNNSIFIDARSMDSYKNGHIKNALPSHPYQKLIDNIFEKFGFDHPLIVYCDSEHCDASQELAYRLTMDGFSNIYVFGGGWDYWIEANLPIDK